MKLDALNEAFKHFKGVQYTEPKPSVEPTVKGQQSFGDMFNSAIKEVDELQKQADDQVQGLTLKKDGYTTHGAMVALEKADTAFQLMNNIRAKIVRAYEDVMRTQV